MFILSRIVTVWFAFLLPAYGTVKALSSRPLSEVELKTWSMYWSVLAVVLAYEYVAEWLISWFPFYWLFKTLFYLFLSLPQTQGSTYVYLNYLEPFCISHREQLDTGIIAMKTNVGQFLQANLSKLWNIVMRIFNKNGQPSQGSATPFNAPAELVKNLLNAYTGNTSTSISRPTDTSSPRRSFAAESRSSSRSSSFVSPPPNATDVPPPFPVPQHF